MRKILFALLIAASITATAGVPLVVALALHGLVVYGVASTHVTVQVPIPGKPATDTEPAAPEGFTWIDIPTSDAYKPPGSTSSTPTTTAPKTAFKVSPTASSGYFKYATDNYFDENSLLDALFKSTAQVLKNNGSYGCSSSDTDSQCIQKSGVGGFAPRELMRADIDYRSVCDDTTGFMSRKNPATTSGKIHVQVSNPKSTTSGKYCGVISDDIQVTADACPAGSVLKDGLCESTKQLPDSVADGTCAYLRDTVNNRYEHNPFDPDCASVREYVTQQPPTSSGEGERLVIIPLDGSVTEIQQKPTPNSLNGETSVRRQDPTPGGGTAETVLKIDESGKVTEQTSGNRSGSPAPVPPGSPAVTTASAYPAVTTYPGAGTACGAYGQAACRVTIDPGTGGTSITDSVVSSLSSGPGAYEKGSLDLTPITAENSELPDVTGQIGLFKDVFKDWTNFELINKPISSCPVLKMDFILYKFQYQIESNAMCELLDRWFVAIKAVFVLSYVITGLFIVLSA